MPLRIVYFAPFDLNCPAGHTSHVLATVEEFSRRGHVVVLFSIGCPANIGRNVQFKKIPVILTVGLQSVSFCISCLVVLLYELLRYKIDLLYTRYQIGLSLPLLIAKAVRLPVVLEVNSDTANERLANKRGYTFSRVEEVEERLIYKLATAIIAVTEAVALRIVGQVSQVERKVKIVSNGVNTRLFRPLDRTTCALKHGLHPDRKRVIFAGAFQVWQGILNLVAAMEIVIRCRQDTDLILVGDGPQRKEIEKAACSAGIEKFIKITGYVPEATVSELVGASDLCAAPYNRMSINQREFNMDERGALMLRSPLKVYMYLACGRPVVASCFRESGEYVEVNEAGFAVPPENPEELARAILALLGDPTKAKAMGERGRQLALDYHDWSKVVDRYLEIAYEIV